MSVDVHHLDVLVFAVKEGAGQSPENSYMPRYYASSSKYVLIGEGGGSSV